MTSTAIRFGLTTSEMERWEKNGTSQSTRKQAERYRRQAAAARAERLAEWRGTRANIKATTVAEK